MRGHFEGDPQKYRDAAEIADTERRDPIKRAEQDLRALGVPEAEIAAAAETARRRVDDAVAAARAGSAPAPADALADVYSRAADARP